MAAISLVGNMIAPGGGPASGCLLNSFIRNTTTRSPLYSNVGLSTPTTNPYVGDADGRLEFYFDSTIEYEWSVTTSDGATVIWEADIIGGVVTVTYADGILIHSTWAPPLATALGDGWAALLAGAASGVLDDLSGIRFVPTYAALTALDAGTGLTDNGVYYTYARTAEEDGGAGFWRYDSASTATANGGTVVAINGGGAGRFFRLYNKGQLQATWFGITVGDDAADAANAAAINATMLQCSVDGGGVVEIPPTLSGADIAINAPLDNCYDNVIVRGAGASDIHDAPGSQPGTALKCTAAITALKMRSPYGGSNARKACMGFDKLTVVGVQTRVLEIDSIRRGYVDIAFSGCAGTEAVLVKNGVSFSDLAESADTQRFDFFRVRGYLGPTSADGVVLTGASNANTSLIKQGMIIDIVHYNGHQLRIKNADNIIAEIMGFRLPAGTGQPYYCHGTNAGASTFTSDIEIRGFGGGYIEGTEVSGTTIPAQVLQHGLDITNSATMPTLGTGARVWLQDNFGRIYYLESVAPAYFGSSFTEGEQARSAAGANTPMTFRSNSQDGLRFTDGSRTFTLRINSSGYVELVQLAGSTGINITGNMQLNGLAVSVGANDSGGAGFRLLRIPN